MMVEGTALGKQESIPERQECSINVITDPLVDEFFRKKIDKLEENQSDRSEERVLSH